VKKRNLDESLAHKENKKEKKLGIEKKQQHRNPTHNRSFKL